MLLLPKPMEKKELLPTSKDLSAFPLPLWMLRLQPSLRPLLTSTKLPPLAILLGCAGFAKFAEELEQELGIPVLDGVVCAVKMAEGIVELGKKTSKAKTYRPPESKSFTGMFERFGSRSPELQKKAG